MLDSVCLINMNARLYDPSVSRFMGADDRLPNLYGTQDHNRYSYTRNNPLNATDPSGHALGGGDGGFGDGNQIETVPGYYSLESDPIPGMSEDLGWSSFGGDNADAWKFSRHNDLSAFLHLPNHATTIVGIIVNITQIDGSNAQGDVYPEYGYEDEPLYDGGFLEEAGGGRNDNTRAKSAGCHVVASAESSIGAQFKFKQQALGAKLGVTADAGSLNFGFNTDDGFYLREEQSFTGTAKIFGFGGTWGNQREGPALEPETAGDDLSNEPWKPVDDDFLGFSTSDAMIGGLSIKVGVDHPEQCLQLMGG